jgi:membrane-associated phospholipid phosphatase
LRLAAGVAVSLINLVLYMVANRYPLGTAHVLPWTSLDAAVPFVPATIWVYLSEYVIVATAFLLCRSVDDVLRFVKAFLVTLGIAITVHMLWPTTFPRELFAAGSDGLTGWVLALQRAADRPTSCLPSMHVAGAALAAFSLWRNPLWQRVAFTTWAGAIALSTLTARQHYVVDVAAGIVLAGAAWLVFIVRPAHVRVVSPAQQLAHSHAR